MRIRVWDIPTRVFHWLLAFAYLSVFLTSRSESLLDYHTTAGYLALGLVVFRIVWGFAGTRYSRFSEFVKGWREVRSFLAKALSREPIRYIGHNPAVAWVILLMLTVTVVVTVTGVITYGGEEGLGVWAGYFTFEMAAYAKPVHTYLAYFAVFLIAVHISAALFHDFILKENIIASMFTGTKEDEGGWSISYSRAMKTPEKGHPLARLSVWIIVTVMASLALVYLPPEYGEGYRVPIVRDQSGAWVELHENELWREECATSCHGAFSPTLLPAESWRMIMANLDDHFGDDASLDEESEAEILEYLLASPAERSRTEASRKILKSITPGMVYMRVTETPYWKRKHSDIGGDVYKRSSIVSRSNCKACHPGSDAGSFEDADIRIPD
ncbi:MAG: cytochrome b/b6 domain-containing protein [Thermodesulfobacteriota bacterium]